MGFNIATQLLGCKKGHAVNAVIDAVLPIAATAIPGGTEAVSAVIAATSPNKAPSGPAQPALPYLDIPQPTCLARVAERILLELDPGLLTLIDEAIVHYAGEEAAAAIEKVVNQYLEVGVFTAPKE